MIAQLLDRSWEPWSEMRQLQRQMNHLFDRHYGGASEFPPVNIWSGEDDIVLTSEIPGVKADDLDISVKGNILTLKGSRKIDEPEGDRAWHRRELSDGAFERSWRLPFSVDADGIDARLENGVLKLTLPRAEKDKPKKIKVNS